MQRNLVYVVGLPLEFCHEEVSRLHLPISAPHGQIAEASGHVSTAQNWTDHSAANGRCHVVQGGDCVVHMLFIFATDV